MSGFDKSWLSLREPADRQARDKGLVADLCRYVRQQPEPSLLDIGCGTGSTFRSLNRELPPETQWHLLDYDPQLLQAAAASIGAAPAVRFSQHDLNDLAHLPLDGVQVVTASALFDLCSDRFCAAFAAHLAQLGCGVYAALNYDGQVFWSHAHPLDEAVVAAFNIHQRTDKGLGPALGPDAAESLERHFAGHGFSVKTAESPWQMDRNQAALQRTFLEGFREPCLEVGGVSENELEAWLVWRIAAIDRPESRCIVGHKDVLALPEVSGPASG